MWVLLSGNTVKICLKTEGFKRKFSDKQNKTLTFVENTKENSFKFKEENYCGFGIGRDFLEHP